MSQHFFLVHLLPLQVGAVRACKDYHIVGCKAPGDVSSGCNLFMQQLGHCFLVRVFELVVIGEPW